MGSVDLDDLYGLPLDRFIPERASLVRELRSGGEREQAAAVAAVRKPSVAAWAVNQLTRTQRREMDALFAAGDALRDVQAGVLSGSADARDLRAAAEHERAAVDALVATARGLLSSGGLELSAAALERVSETLHAAALDDEARGQVSGGRLVRELRHVGLGAGLGGAIAAPPARRGAPRSAAPAREAGKGGTRKATTRDVQAERQAARERKAAEAAERREREELRKQARALERDAAREVDRAERALRTAQERQGRAAEALRQAEAALRDAEAGVEAAVAAHRQAQQRLDGATG
jgi:flagellar biosynthesis GTPase FlhF